MSLAGTPALVLDEVTVRLGDRTILDAVSAEITSGELVWLRGPSGVGKTILVELLAGFRTPDAGRVLVHGEPVGPARPPAWRSIAVVPQSLGVPGHLSVREHVVLPLVLAGGAAGGPWRADADQSDAIDVLQPSSPADATLAALDLHELASRLASELSLGQRQRLAVARAVVGRPAVLVADEPTSHQDVHHAGLLLRVLADLVSAGAAAVVASHDPALVEVATRVLHLEGGHLVADTLPADRTG